MANQQDYDAIAKQFGGVNYDEIAKEFGGVQAGQKSAATPSAIDTFSNQAMRYGREAMRQGGIAGKNLAEGVVGTFGLITDTPAKIYDAAAYLAGGKPSPQFMKPAESFIQGMEQLGGPELQPRDATERVVGDIQRGVGGVATGLGAGRALSSAVSPVTKKLAELLSSSPGRQLAVAGVTPVAGEITKQAGGGPAAQMAAQLATTTAIGGYPSKTSYPTNISTESLAKASTAAYGKAKSVGAVFKPSAYDDFVNDLIPKVKSEGYDVGLHPKAAAVLNRLQSEKGQPQTIENMEILRRVAKNAAGSLDKDERRIGMLIQNNLDDFVDTAGPNSLLKGDRAAVDALKEARALYSRKSKAEAIEDLIDRAKISAPNFSGSGMENALRTEFRALAKNKNRMRGFSPDEQEAIRKVAMGGPVENVLRQFGKLAPTGVVSTGLSSGLGFMLGGPAGAAAIPAAGLVARQGATELTKRNAQFVAELMRQGKLPIMDNPYQKRLAATLAAMTQAESGQPE